MQRFFVTSESVVGNGVMITGDNARHISLSLRMRKGDTVSVCTPDMTQYDCELTEFGDGFVKARITDVCRCSSEPPQRVRIYQALPKGDKAQTVIQKSVECGAYSVTFFESSRCIAKLDASSEKKLERWNRISEEAAKQCGRGLIPRVEQILSFREMIDEAKGAALPLFCYENEGDNPLGRVLSDNPDGDISVVIGAEGGFSPEEAEYAKKNGMISVGLGSRILRCETVSCFVLACISMSRELS